MPRAVPHFGTSSVRRPGASLVTYRIFRCTIVCTEATNASSCTRNTSQPGKRTVSWGPQAQLQADFLALMHQRFLAGEEEGVDYPAIDGNAALDDDLASQMEQDAEDAYFDND